MTNLNARFMDSTELESLSFAALGSNVLIHSTVVIVNCANIKIGSNVRIDAYAVISAGGGVSICNNVHIASHCCLTGRADINLHDFTGLSQGVRIFSSSDDYSGACLTNPTVPDRFKGVKSAPVTLARHVIIGAGTVILPGVTIGEGTAVGALSLVSQTLPPWSICAGTPARRVKERRQDLLRLEKILEEESK